MNTAIDQGAVTMLREAYRVFKLADRTGGPRSPSVDYGEVRRSCYVPSDRLIDIALELLAAVSNLACNGCKNVGSAVMKTMNERDASEMSGLPRSTLRRILARAIAELKTKHGSLMNAFDDAKDH